MILERITNGFQSTVPCKVNLFLDVLSKRRDGYHSVDTVMMAVSLADVLRITGRKDNLLTLRIEFSEDAGNALVEDDPAWKIPADSTNLVLRGLEKLRNLIGKPDAGADVVLTKRIPAMAGLGGGSANCAAALVIGSLLWQKTVNFDQVISVASELGSDINFFIEAHRGGYWLARCTGRGEKIEPLVCQEPFHFVIVHPPVGCSTQKVFDSLQGINEANTSNPRSIENLVRYIQKGDVPALGKELFNRLEEPAMLTTDWVERSRRRLDRYNHHGQSMSGSGSARFCLCDSAEQAEKIVREIKLHGDMRAFSASSWQSPGIEEQVKNI